MVEPTGYTALDLIGFTDKGPYDPDANYVRNDLVHVGNSTWRCKIDDTTGITPTEGANWTIFIESATSLAGMSDVELNTPKAGDGLVHDGNDWTNIPIMTKEQWKKSGAYNLCPNDATSQSLGGLLFTVDSDDLTITVGSGTASAQAALTLASSVHFKPGTYKVCGTPEGGNYNTGYSFFVAKGSTTVATDTTNTLGLTDEFTVTSESDSYNIYVMVRNGTIIASSIIFKPLITTDLNATYADYVPYAKTNRELTEELKTVPNGNGIFFTKATGGSIENNASWAEKYGKVIVVNLQVKFSTSASSPALGTLSIKPKYMSTALVVAGGSLSTVSVNTSSGVISLNGNISSGWIYGQLVFVYE